MKVKKPSNDLIGISGVHFVVSELSRRGLIALPTVKNCAAYDILVANKRGSRHANLQVKTSFGTGHFWPMPPSTKIRTRDDDFYVFLRWVWPEKRFRGYMLPGRNVRAEVKRAEEITKQKGQRPFGAFYVGKRARGKDLQWIKYWERWKI